MPESETLSPDFVAADKNRLKVPATTKKVYETHSTRSPVTIVNYVSSSHHYTDSILALEFFITL